MKKFWTNIIRYSRFIIASTIGLVFVILAPLKNLIKIKKSNFFFLILFLILFYFIFKSMFVIG